MTNIPIPPNSTRTPPQHSSPGSNTVTSNPLNAALALLLLGLLGGGFVLSALGLTSAPLTWSLLRASGIVAYLVLALTVTFGALLGSRYAPPWLARAQQYGWHGLISGFALVLGSAHGLFLAVDGQYAQPLSALLLPGTSSFAPLAIGLGSLGSYALALVYFSTLWRKHLSLRVWRALHFAAYPAFAALTLHSILIGSDHLGLLYGAAVAAATLTFGLRFLEEVGKRNAQNHTALNGGQS